MAASMKNNICARAIWTGCLIEAWVLLVCIGRLPIRHPQE
jgi:hypothetical protein